MADAGWYPDPGGAPGRFRYWDGRSWSSQTTTDPARTPPLGGTRSLAVGERGPDRGWLVALIVLALVTALAVVALLAWGGRLPFGPPGAREDTNSSTPTVDPWNETSTPTLPPTMTGGGWAECPATKHQASTAPQPGRLTASRLSINQPPPDWYSEVHSWELPFVYDLAVRERLIVSGEWLAHVSVSRLAKDEWQGGLATIATRVTSCIETFVYFTEVSSTQQVRSEAFSVDGHPAWRITTNIYVPSPPQVEGDRVDVILVDLGDDLDHYGLYSSSCTLNEAAGLGSCADIDAAIESLEVS